MATRAADHDDARARIPPQRLQRLGEAISRFLSDLVAPVAEFESAWLFVVVVLVVAALAALLVMVLASPAPAAPIWKLEPSFRCRSCGTRRYKPPVRMIKLTEQREITPYKWVHPDEER